jgi:hypothetical protein
MAFSFEKLVVCQKAVDFGDTDCAATGQFPRGYGFLIDQFNRAALSIAANNAEGNGRFTKPDRKNFSALLGVRARSVSHGWNWPDAVVFFPKSGTPASNPIGKRFPGY